jgi:amino acid adenylation domain-containing protein
MLSVDRLSDRSFFYPPGNTEFISVGERISRIADSAPDSTAIFSERGGITFGDLIQRASRLAESLNCVLDEKPGIVAIATDDSLDLIVSALAIWRTGSAYLPVSPSGPPERLNHVLSEAGVSVVLTSPTAVGPWPASMRQLSMVGEPGDGYQFVSRVSSSGWKIAPEDLAYVIYTSGSSGQPKGVAVTQANLSYLIQWYAGAFHPTPRDSGTQFAALTFDAAVLETWPILAAGASLHIPERSIALRPERLRDYLVSRQITHCFAATPIAEQLISLSWPRNTPLRFLLTGADTLRMFPPSGLPFQLVNNYGPTECTVLVTSGIVPAGSDGNAIPTIGKPIPGTEIYLLDSSLQPVREGDCGQICAAGPSVAAGYIGRPDLTKERFIYVSGLNARLYLTGDLGRKLSTGELSFHGRLDDQIKIRGLRIEPGEIVTALRRHPAVAAAAVTAIGGEQHKQLAAYVVLRSEVDADGLRSHLAARLPANMTPAVFVRVNELPLTVNGKVNFAALPAPDRSNSLERVTEAAKPENEIQVQVASILSSLLGGRELGLNDNFFRLGGHSLLAAQVIARVQKTFGVDLALRTIFESPTVAALSNQIALLQRHEKPSAPSLAETQLKAKLRPFFCVHTHGWDLQAHDKIARVLGPERPFYGLQPSSVIGEGTLNFTVEELAAKYIGELKKIQPAGPYHLGGYCFAGLVAFEMAQQLRAQGEDIALLALIDSFVPGEQSDFPIRPIRRTPFWRLDTYLGEFLWRSPKQRVAYIKYLMRFLVAPSIKLRWARAKGDGAGPIDNRWPDLESANGRAYSAYIPKPYAGRIVLFWGADHSIRSFHDRRLGWSEFAEGGLEVFVIPGAQRIFPARLRHSTSERSRMVTVDRTTSVSWSAVAERLRKYLQSSPDAISASAQWSSASSAK